MPVRRLPVRPHLEQLHRQAKELLRAIHAGDANAIAELREHHPESIAPPSVKLADAQFVLARSYRASSWAWTRMPWSTSSERTVGTRPPSIASWRCTSSTASSLPTRQ
jgi:hypothetical protein